MAQYSESKNIKAAGRMLSRASATSIWIAWQELSYLLMEAGEILPGQINPSLLNIPENEKVEAKQSFVEGSDKEREEQNKVKSKQNSEKKQNNEAYFMKNGSEDPESITVQGESPDPSSLDNLPIAPDDDWEDTDTQGESDIWKNDDRGDANDVNVTSQQKEAKKQSSNSQGNSFILQAGTNGQLEIPSAKKKDKQEEVTFEVGNECKLEISISARSEGNSNIVPLSATNEHAIEGVLFQADTISEGAPSIGPGTPLYIPRVVALEAIENLNNSQSPKPLDAHDSLSEHANTEIVGAIINARLEGNDFIIRGVLYDANQPDKVRRIISSKDELGLSVNAIVRGGLAKSYDNRDVFIVEDITILGANILFASHATYRNTRIISASKRQDPQSFQESLKNKGIIPISASEESQDNRNQDKQGETMDYSVIQNFSQQLQQISASLDEQFNEFSREIRSIQDTTKEIQNQNNSLQQRVEKLEAEKEKKKQELQASQQQEKERQEREELVSEVAKKISEMIPNTGSKNGTPKRRTTPLAANSSSNTSSDQSKEQELQVKLAQIDGELRALNSSYAPNYDRIYQLTDERTHILTQLYG